MSRVEKREGGGVWNTMRVKKRQRRGARCAGTRDGVGQHTAHLLQGVGNKLGGPALPCPPFPAPPLCIRGGMGRLGGEGGQLKCI